MAQLELKPQLKDERTDNLSESENTETQVTSEVEPETDKESSEIPEKASSSVKKENINESIKRSTSIKRTPNSTTIQGAKSTPSTISRNAATSKSSSKSNSVFTVRKSTSNSTASNTKNVSSVYSSGGSGDEKRKSLISSTRRTSLTPLSQHQPVKVESLSEKRGISGINTRKPTSSANPGSLKPVVRSNSTTSKSASIVKRSSSVNAKSSTSGTLSDSKKRLSTAPGSVISTKPLARIPSTSTKEVDQLKAKLEISTTKIDDQEKEIKTTQDNFDKLSKQLEEETQKSALTEENLKTEHKEELEKLETDLKAKLRNLQSELEKAQSALIDAQGISAQSVEEARQNEALKNANSIQELKDGFELVLSSLNTELADIKANCASLTSKLTGKEDEIKSLNSQIIKANEQQNTLQQEHSLSISTLQQSLLEEKEAALHAMRLELDELALKQDDQIKSIQNKETAALTEKYELKINELQTTLDKTKASLTEAEEKHEKALESYINESENRISILQSEISELKSEVESKSKSLIISVQSIRDIEEKYESLEIELQNSRVEFTSLSEKFTNLENQHSTELQELRVARDELTQVKAQLNKQIQMMQTFNDDGKSKDELYSRVNSELEIATKKLDENDNEIANLRKKIEEFEQNSLYNIKTIASLKEEVTIKKATISEITEKLEQDKNLQSELIRTQNEAEFKFKEQLSLLENKIMNLERENHDFKTTFPKSIEEAKQEACQELKTTHFKILQDLETNHKEVLSNLQQDQANLISESSAMIEKLQTTGTNLEKQLEELKNKLSEAQGELNTNQQYLAQEKMEKAQALAELDALRNKKIEIVGTKDLNSKQKEGAKKEEAENDHLTEKAFEQLQEKLILQEKESTKKYSDLEEKMRRLVEEKTHKAKVAENRLIEIEALLKLKETDISESKLVSQDEKISSVLIPEEINTLKEIEGEQDNSSAALASLAQAMILADQATQMINETPNYIFGPPHTLAEISPKAICYDENNTKTV